MLFYGIDDVFFSILHACTYKVIFVQLALIYFLLLLILTEPGFDGGEVPSQRDPLKRGLALQKISRQSAPGGQEENSEDDDGEFGSFGKLLSVIYLCSEIIQSSLHCEKLNVLLLCIVEHIHTLPLIHVRFFFC